MGFVKEVPSPAGSVSQRKVRQILDAAVELFTEFGFGDTSMDAVSRRAKVGKATVYAHFKNKCELFKAAVTAEMKIDCVTLGSPLGRPVEIILSDFGRYAFDTMLDAKSVKKFRSVAADTHRQPDLGQHFLQNGLMRLQGILARFLEEADGVGVLSVADPARAASQFLALITGDSLLRAIVRVDEMVDPVERDKIIRDGLDVFLIAYRPR